MSLNSTLPWAATTVAMAKRPAGSINHSCNKLPQKKNHFSPVLVVTDCWSELIVRQVRYYTHEDSARPDYTKSHLDFGIWVRSQILGASLCEPCGLFSRQMCWLFNHFWSYSTYKWFITSFFSLGTQQITDCHNLICCSLSWRLRSPQTTNVWQQQCCATAVLILIAVVAATVVLLGLLLWAAIK